MEINNKKKVWSLRYSPGNSESDALIRELSRDLNISRVVATLIYNRGFSDPERGRNFLNPVEERLHDPFLMKDMDKAVKRVAEAVEKGERITVYGDYDVDGVTSVTLLYLYLESIGADVDYYIPLRTKEGYGVSTSAIEALAQNGTKLIITVDTGITANKEIEYAKELGIDTVVTDHHECHGELPIACAVVNPHRPDCEYPFCELAGVGVVFKFVCGYEIARCPEIDPCEAVKCICSRYIDLVAVGTVADVMPLIDENRIIVKLGLLSIDEDARIGLAALIEAANNANSAKAATGADKNTKKRRINSGYISFSLAPRINAAGRISSASKAVELLLAEDEELAAELAEELCEINLVRQREENRIAEAAYRMIEDSHNFKKDKVIVLENDRWQQGIIGIVSSRITEKYGLPSILISFDGATDGDGDPHDIGKGSGRSVKGMNLVDALDHCKEHLVQFGGHELAAGLSVMRCNIDDFRKKINDYARENFSDDLFVMKYEADCEISEDDLTMETVDELSMLEPFGVANQTPTFIVRNMRFEKAITMGAGRQHSKLFLSLNGKSYTAICFGTSAETLNVYFGESVDVLCQLSINEFRGQKSLQLIVQDLRLTSELSARYDEDKSRYNAIKGGERVLCGEDIIPTRADVAQVYKFLRYECMCGRNLFGYRQLKALIFKQMNFNVSTLKLMLITDILGDMKVCKIDRLTEEYFECEICKNAEKGNVELTSTYKTLEALSRT